MFDFCFHKWGKIEDGYQYCTKCGKAIKVECNHKWEEYHKFDICDGWSGNNTSVKYVDKCSKCGERKIYRVDA